MSDERLIHDVADATARQLVGLINWDREEQTVDAYHEFYAAVRAGLHRYRLLKDRELRRLGRSAPDLPKSGGGHD